MTAPALTAAAALAALMALAASLPIRSFADEVYAAHNQILVLNGETRKQVGSIPLDEVVNGIAFSKDGSRAFVGASGGKAAGSTGGLYVIDAATGKVLVKASTDPVKELRTSPDGRRLHLLEWRVRVPEKSEKPEKSTRKRRPIAEPFRLRTIDITGREPATVGAVTVGPDLYDLAVSPDQKTAYLLDPGNNLLRVMDLQSNSFLEPVPLSGGRKADGTYYEAALAKLAFSPDGARALVLQSGPARTGALFLELDARRRRQVLVPGGSNIRAGVLLSEGRLLALSIERLLVVDLAGGKLDQAVPLRETFTSLAVSRDGLRIYLGSPVSFNTEGARGGGLVDVRDAESLALLGNVPLPISVRLLTVAPPRKPAEE